MSVSERDYVGEVSEANGPDGIGTTAAHRVRSLIQIPRLSLFYTHFVRDRIADPTGFEPATSWSGTRDSVH